jgi:phage terminase Nu1 subunit (DNA packaging protein)
VAVEIVTKAELSRILGLSRARVTQYANMGMPVLSDGKLDLAACLDWLSQNVYLWNNRWLDRGVFRLVQGPGISRRGSRVTSMARPRTRNGGPRSGAPAGGARDSATSAEYLHQKVRQIRAAADKLQISNARRRGELVPVDEVRRRHEEILLMLRDRVLRVESVVPLLYAAARDGGMEAMRPILREELRDALDLGPVWLLPSHGSSSSSS